MLTIEERDESKAGAVGIRDGDPLQRAAELMQKVIVRICFLLVIDRRWKDGEGIYPLITPGEDDLADVRHRQFPIGTDSFDGVHEIMGALN